MAVEYRKPQPYPTFCMESTYSCPGDVEVFFQLASFRALRLPSQLYTEFEQHSRKFACPIDCTLSTATRRIYH